MMNTRATSDCWIAMPQQALLPYLVAAVYNLKASKGHESVQAAIDGHSTASGTWIERAVASVPSPPILSTFCIETCILS